MKTLIFAIALSTCLCAHGQGTVNFNNRIAGVVVAPVYGPETGNQTVLKTGNASDGFPAGTQTYTGALLTGTGYSAQLYGGTTSTTENSLIPLSAPVSFRTGSVAGFVVAPLDYVTVPGVLPGSQAHLQLRAWDNGSGTITSYESAFANSFVNGKSAMFTSQPLGGVNGPGVDLVGLTSFSLVNPIPEPSTIVLGVIGAAALFFRRKES